MRNKMMVGAYWTVTLVVALETVVGGISDLIHGRALLVAGAPVADIVTHLGYPVYILRIIGFWKVLGGIVLLLPSYSQLKEWAYAGIFFELSGAAASWLLYEHNVQESLAPMILAALVLLSRALLPPSNSAHSQHSEPAHQTPRLPA